MFHFTLLWAVYFLVLLFESVEGVFMEEFVTRGLLAGRLRFLRGGT